MRAAIEILDMTIGGVTLGTWMLIVGASWAAYKIWRIRREKRQELARQEQAEFDEWQREVQRDSEEIAEFYRKRDFYESRGESMPKDLVEAELKRRERMKARDRARSARRAWH